MIKDEHQLQSICCAFCEHQYPSLVMWSSLSGIKLTGASKYGVIQKEKQSCFKRGIPDIYIALPNGKSLHIEFKNPNGKGKQSSDQKLMQKSLEKLGHLYTLVDSFQQFKDILAEHTSILEKD